MIFALTSDDISRVYNGITVLVVDDDEAIRESVRVMLEDEGYAVLEAEDGAVALGILRTSPAPIVVITNHRMPHLDGPGLIDAVHRDLRLSARHALIYMTANAELISPTLRGELHDLQSAILAKPFLVSSLLDAVSAAAERLPQGPGQDGLSEPDGSSLPR